jgi:ribonucleotide reductase alpha subunit
MKQYGIINSQLLAPNTSTSLIQNATASVLPVFDTFLFDSSSKGIYPVIPKFYNEIKYYYITYGEMQLNNVIYVISSIQKWI